MRALCSEHGLSTGQLVTIMSGSVAKRLGDPLFDGAVGRVFSLSGVPCGRMLFSRGSFSSRIAEN